MRPRLGRRLLKDQLPTFTVNPPLLQKDYLFSKASLIKQKLHLYKLIFAYVSLQWNTDQCFLFWISGGRGKCSIKNPFVRAFVFFSSFITSLFSFCPSRALYLGLFDLTECHISECPQMERKKGAVQSPTSGQNFQGGLWMCWLDMKRW